MKNKKNFNGDFNSDDNNYGDSSFDANGVFEELINDGFDPEEAAVMAYCYCGVYPD